MHGITPMQNPHNPSVDLSLILLYTENYVFRRLILESFYPLLLILSIHPFPPLAFPLTRTLPSSRSLLLLAFFPPLSTFPYSFHCSSLHTFRLASFPYSSLHPIWPFIPFVSPVGIISGRVEEELVAKNKVLLPAFLRVLNDLSWFLSKLLRVLDEFPWAQLGCSWILIKL